MTFETVLVVAGVWIAIGIVVYRWAFSVASKESERQLNERERTFEENVREQARLAKELEATRAELRLLRDDRAASRNGWQDSSGCGPSRPCLGQ